MKRIVALVLLAIALGGCSSPLAVRSQSSPTAAPIAVSPSPTETPTPTLTAVPSPTPTLIPTVTHTPTHTPTFTPTLTRTPTLTPTPTRVPFLIDPRLSLYVESALARLEGCAPDIYAVTAEYVQQFKSVDGDASHWDPHAHAVELIDSAVHAGLSTDADEIGLMETIAHESRHAWQTAHWIEILDIWSNPVERERDAYRYTLQIFDRCPTTDPFNVLLLRRVIERRAVNPPSH